jgi:integrase
MRSIPRRDDDPKNGYSRRSINGMMKVIKVSLKHAARLDIITRNPADKIELLADDTRIRGVLTKGELERLFKLQWNDERGKIAAIGAATSGMRLGEIVALQIVRRERNILFHGFRHFFNSTIRGSVSDDILRLQTGHSDGKMTDQYDHITDDRGEQLRKAVQKKILPFIPKAAGGVAL